MAVYINGVIGEDVQTLDVIGQVKKHPSGEPLTVYIDSPGGYMDDGFAIHDYLKSLDTEVTTIARGMCASIATVIFLAGSKRITHCDLMIHNPWAGAEGDSQEMMDAANMLAEAEKRIEKFYAERLSIDPAVISGLMAKETHITPNQALSLGFATQASEKTIEAKAYYKPKPKKTMKDETVNASVMQKVLKKLGFRMRGNVLNLELSAADGTTFTVERDEGEPAVGDKAAPDGTYVMPDGSTIVVRDGVITDIAPAEGEHGTDDSEPAPEERIKELENENVSLKDEIAELKMKIVSDEERDIVTAVKELGGRKVLAKMVSNYHPTVREGDTTGELRNLPRYKQELINLKNKKKQ